MYVRGVSVDAAALNTDYSTEAYFLYSGCAIKHFNQFVSCVALEMDEGDRGPSRFVLAVDECAFSTDPKELDKFPTPPELKAKYLLPAKTYRVA